MENISYQTGNLLNGMLSLIGTNLLAGPVRTYGYVFAIILELSLLGVTGKAVYDKVKDNNIYSQRKEKLNGRQGR